MKWMDEQTHKLVIDNVPLACIDLLILCQDKYLLIKRERFPVPVYWLPGGRVFLNEPLDDAAKRIAKDECGLDITIKRLIGAESTVFERGPYENQGINTINLIYLGLSDSFDVKLDANHSDYRWDSCSGNIDSSLHPYVRNFISAAFLEV